MGTGDSSCLSCLYLRLSFQTRSSKNVTLSHGMALSHKKSGISSAQLQPEALWHNAPGKQTSYRGSLVEKHHRKAWWLFSHAEVRISVLSSYLEPISQHLPAGAGAQALARCYSHQRWCEITYEGRAGPSPATGFSSAQRMHGWELGVRDALEGS